MPNLQLFQKKNYLHEISSKDRSWDFNKSASKIVERYFKEADYQKLAERVKNCASKLSFKIVRDSEQKLKLKLQPTFLCHVRLCPICQASRTRVLRAKLNKIIPVLTEANPKMRFIFLTLTVKNCKLTDLKKTIQHMSKSYTKLFKLKPIKSINKGYIKSLEITRSAIDECHPHFHVLLAVNPSYFSLDYITQAEWTYAWQKSLDVDYNPIVHIKTVHNHKETCDVKSIQRAVMEVAKYMIKPMDLIGKGGKRDRDFYIELGNQIHGIKARNTSGIFKTYLGDFEAKEEEIFDHDQDDSDNIEENAIIDTPLDFYFNQQDKKYVLVDAIPF